MTDGNAYSALKAARSLIAEFVARLEGLIGEDVERALITPVAPERSASAVGICFLARGRWWDFMLDPNDDASSLAELAEIMAAYVESESNQAPEEVSR